MANAQVIWHLSKDFLQRNNPVVVAMGTLTETVNNLVTFNSKMKLLKYKFMLAQQQLNRMEQNVHQGSPYEVKGHRIDKAY